MRVFNDFRCDQCGSTEELFLENGTTHCTCQSCGGTARKVQRPIRSKLPTNDPGFPGAYDKWAKDRDKKIAAEKKLETH